MASRNVVVATGVLVFLAACGSVAPTPTVIRADSSAPHCPAGPNTTTASLSTLPTGACTTDDGPCYYEGTPCPSVTNGTVNSYVCTCASATWSCELSDQSGLCAPLPADDAGLDYDAGVSNDAGRAVDAGSDATIQDAAGGG